jgi:hypothetical protein
MTGALRTADLVAEMADYILSQQPSRFTAQTLPHDQSLPAMELIDLSDYPVLRYAPLSDDEVLHRGLSTGRLPPGQYALALRRGKTVHLARDPVGCSKLFFGHRFWARDPGLWMRAMTEWPMGGFARMTADFLIGNDLLGGKVLELGAGVGSCRALVASHVSDQFIRSDLQPFLLKRQRIAGTVERYDFNEPGKWRDLDAIFAVNALHCAKDKPTSLSHLRAMLRQDGALVLGEGHPYTDTCRTPWASIASSASSAAGGTSAASCRARAGLRRSGRPALLGLSLPCGRQAYTTWAACSGP